MDIDLTAEGLNTLSEDSLQVAKNVNETTELFIIGSEDTVRSDQLYSSYGVKYSQLANLADKLSEANSLITVEYIDPDTNPNFISDYSAENLTSGCVLVRTEKRYKVLTAADLFSVQQDSSTGSYVSYSMVDGALANAIHLVSLDNVPVAAIATGHDEMLSSSALTGFQTLLEDNSFSVESFDILTAEIPENTQLLLIPTPTTDYTDEEIAKLNAFLSDNGSNLYRSVMVSCYPTQGTLPKLEAFLEEWGVNVDQGTVYETDQNNCLSSGVSHILAKSSSDLLTGTYDTLVMPASMPLSLAFDNNNGIQTYSLIESADTAAVTTDGNVAENPETGVQTLAAMGRKMLETSDGGSAYVNVTVLGTANMLTSSLLDTSAFSDRDFITDLVHYSTNTEDTSLGLTVQQVQTNTSDIVASSWLIGFLGLGVFTVLIPLAILAAGLVVFLRRRHL